MSDGPVNQNERKPEEEASHGIKRFDATKGFESKQDRLTAARKAVGRIVGRDTSELSEEGVTKATVETVAENFADGVLAPLLYLAIGGAPLALTYKAVNTMDSMLGYKNENILILAELPQSLMIFAALRRRGWRLCSL